MSTGFKNEIKVNTKIIPKDFRNYTYTTFFNNNGTRSIIFLGVLVILSFANISIQLLNKGAELPKYLFFIPAGFLMFFIIVPININGLSKKILSQNTFFIEEQFHTITDSYVEVKTKSTSKKVFWSKVYKVIESRHCFSLILSLTIEEVIIIPKRSFDSTEDINNFREIIIKNVTKSKRKLK